MSVPSLSSITNRRRFTFVDGCKKFFGGSKILRRADVEKTPSLLITLKPMAHQGWKSVMFQ
jgi:hypothetical protein